MITSGIEVKSLKFALETKFEDGPLFYFQECFFRFFKVTEFLS